MEIKYTNFELDSKTYGKNELVGLIDKTGTFIYNTVYDVKPLQYSDYMPMRLYLSLGVKRENRRLIPDMLEELEIGKELNKRPLASLSTGELIKVLTIKACLSSTIKTVVLEYIDSYLSYRDLNNLLKTIKNHMAEIDKTVIFSTNKADNIIMYSDRYIITENDKITYNGKDFKEIDVPTEISKFVASANKKHAKLELYKDSNDLLKAIYRSVKK